MSFREPPGEQRWWCVALLLLAVGACKAKNPAYTGVLPSSPRDGMSGAADGMSGAADGMSGATDGMSGAANGAICAAASECSSGVCLDRTCCARPCVGPCSACNVPGSAGACVQVPVTSRIGYWKLDETGGITAANAACGGADGMLKQYASVASAWQPGRVGGALAFDGSQRMEVADLNDRLDAVASTGAFTLALWAFRGQPRPGSYTQLAGRQDRDQIGEHFAILFDENGGGIPLLLVNSTNQVGSYYCLGPQQIAASEWHHYAATDGGGVARLYFDGKEVCSFVPTGSSFVPDTNPLVIGAGFNDGSGVQEEGFVGLIDEVLLYGRALSSSEIAALANGSAPPAQ